MDALLSLDLGTTGCKAAVYALDGISLGSSYLEYELIHPRAEQIEQDANLWWRLAKESTQQALALAQVHRPSIRAVSVCSQGLSFVPINRSGQVLRNAISWLDTRAAEQANQIASQIDEAHLFQLTGKRPAAAYLLPKLLWLREHETELYRGTFKFLMAHDYLVYRLCGATVTDYSMASGTLLLDLSHLTWSEELLQTFSLGRDQLPDLAWSGTVAGELLPSVAKALGLSPGIPVVVGGQDQKCAALGAAIRAGRATVSLGTASAISSLTDKPTLETQRRIPTFPFVIPGYWDLEAVISTSGAALKWVRDTLLPGKDYSELDRLAQQAPLGSNSTRFYPHLTGATSPWWDVKARGSFTGLSLSTNAPDLIRSVLEGIAYQVRSNLDIIQSMAPVDEIVLFGGGAKSRFWSEMISQVCGRPVSVTSAVDVANWGACLLGGVGAGLFRDPFMPGPSGYLNPIASPSRENAAEYDSLYQAYREAELRVLAAN